MQPTSEYLNILSKYKQFKGRNREQHNSSRESISTFNKIILLFLASRAAFLAFLSF